jgi:hypothetical protein
MAMESPAPPSNVVIAFDATRYYSQDELHLAIEGVKLAGGILRGGDTLLMLGVLHKVLHPCKCSMDCVSGIEAVVFQVL